ncbi:unnamed protein product [Phaeothamnion confervicola]
MLRKAADDRKRKHSVDESPLKARPELSLLCGVSNVLQFLGTSFNHASRTHEGHRCDCTCMYGVVWYFVPYAVVRQRYWKHGGIRRSEMVLFVASLAAGLLLFWPLTSVYYTDPRCELIEALTVASLALLTLALDRRFTRRHRGNIVLRGSLIGAAAGVLIFGAICQKLDIRKVGCNPMSFFQLHGVWHCCSASTLLLVYQYFRSERRVAPAGAAAAFAAPDSETERLRSGEAAAPASEPESLWVRD